MEIGDWRGRQNVAVINGGTEDCKRNSTKFSNKEMEGVLSFYWRGTKT
jgi:hypothetical protein